jgi:hypothetical protein
MIHLLKNENKDYIVQLYYKKEEIGREMYTIMTDGTVPGIHAQKKAGS